MRESDHSLIKKNQWIFLFALIMLMLTGCEQAVTSSSSSENQLTGKLIITGSSTIAPLAAELARSFEKENPLLRVNVQTGGSSRGLSDIRQQLSDIGMVSRKIKANENDVKSYLIAKDGVSIIVHSENPIESLTDEQIKLIYLGKISNWESLNGSDNKITVINKAEGRSTLEVFLHYFGLINRDIKPDIIIGDNEQAVKLVAKNRNAIAYVSIGTAEYNVKAGTKIKTLPLNGISASTEKIASGEFPLSRELNYITNNSPSLLAKAFIQFSQSAQANQIIRDFGFVPIK